MAKPKYSADERAWALESGDYDIYRGAALKLLKGDHLDFLHSSEYYAHLNLFNYDVCRCLWRASRARNRRLRKRLAPMLEAGAWFVTLTFRDEVLRSTSAKTRRVYVRSYLKSICCSFVANKDFGMDFHREHYHAVISLPFDMSTFGIVHDSKGAHSTMVGWDYGFSNWERIGKVGGDGHDLVRVGKYLAKLQNHAVKATASDEVMIFSRSKYL